MFLTHVAHRGISPQKTIGKKKTEHNTPRARMHIHISTQHTNTSRMRIYVYTSEILKHKNCGCIFPNIPTDQPTGATMKQLTAEAQDAVLAWLEEFELSKPARAKTLGRDFSDGGMLSLRSSICTCAPIFVLHTQHFPCSCQPPVLLAQVLKQLYPKLVELHNYPQRNSFTLKLDNWNTLNRKVLRKLDITLAPDTLAQLCNAVPGVLERVCHDIMLKYRADERAGRYDDDATSENSEYYYSTSRLLLLLLRQMIIIMGEGT